MKKKSIEELTRTTLEAYRAAAKLPVAVVLDNVRSQNNIGSVLRTADAFLIEKVVLCGICTPPPSPEIHKTALGAEDSVAWEYCPDTLAAVERLRCEGYIICSIEQVHHSVPLGDFRPEEGKRYALVLGNEVAGVAQEVVDCSDLCLEIPQEGTKHSLNIAVTAGIVMWHFYSQMWNFCDEIKL